MSVTLGVNAGFVEEAPTSDPGVYWSTMDNTARVTGDTSPATAGKITEIGWYCNGNTTACNFEVGLYAADGETVPGEAGTLLYVERTNTKGTTEGWERVTVNWAISSNTKYWIGVQIDDTSPNATTGGASSGGGGNDYLTSQDTLPSPYGGGALGDSDGMYTFYAVWDVSAGTEHEVSASDTLTISDSLSAEKILHYSASDTLTISDSLGTAAEYKVALADTLTMTDLLSVAATYNVALADTLNISDSLSPAAEYVIGLADTLDMSDALVVGLILAEIRRRGMIPRKLGLPRAQNVGVGM